MPVSADCATSVHLDKGIVWEPKLRVRTLLIPAPDFVASPVSMMGLKPTLEVNPLNLGRVWILIQTLHFRPFYCTQHIQLTPWMTQSNPSWFFRVQWRQPNIPKEHHGAAARDYGSTTGTGIVWGIATILHGKLEKEFSAPEGLVLCLSPLHHM